VPADELQIVDSIATNPTVRLNLSGGPWRVRDGTEFPPPPLRRTVVETMLADGSHIPAAAYDDRVLHLQLQVTGEDPDALATQVQALARELDRPRNFIRWRPAGASEWVTWRTYRSPLGELVDQLYARRETTVSVLAEPFGYGERVALDEVTINNDPAAVSNGCFFDVSDVRGDVETPLYLTVGASGVIATGRRTTVMGVRRRGTPSAMPLFLQAESMTLGTNTSLQPNDSVMSGSGQNFVRTTFGTASMTTRLSATFPSSASVDVRGLYRALVRLRKSVSGDTITVRLAVSVDGTVVAGDTVTLPSGTARRWVDLGLIQFPFGPDPGDSFDGLSLPVRGLDLQFQAARSGSGNLDTDVFGFVPADDRLAMVKWPENSGPTSFLVDPYSPEIYALGASGEVRSTQREFTGGLPLVSPGVTNRIVWLLDAGTTSSAGDTLTNTTTVIPHYWPRYLHVRPPST
jgi:hypothetical protein